MMADQITKVWDGGEDWNPREFYTRLVKRCQQILSDGDQRTTRGVYYALEAHGYDYDYDKVKKAVKRGRRAGFINPRQIVDTSRSAPWTVTDGEVYARWSDKTLEYEGLSEFAANVAENLPEVYFQNFWKEQDHYVEVWLEKSALASVFQPITREWNVRLEATRGDWSDSKIYRASQRLIERIMDGNDVRVLYFGDFNPSGFHAPVAVQCTMGKYGLDIREKVDSSDPAYFDIWPFDEPITYRITSDSMGKDGGSARVGNAGSLMFDRIALNPEHITRYDLPENPTPSKSDKDRTIRERFMRYVSSGRDTNVELDALKEFQRDDLEGMIEDGIRQYVDEDAKEAFEEQVRGERDRLAGAINVNREAL